MAPTTQTSPARRSQAERRDESQRGLLRAAAEVIADQGVGAATFDAIGTRAGYSRGLATQRFGSKQGLIEALIADLHERQNSLLAAIAIDALPGLDAVLRYVDLFLHDLNLEGEARAYFMLLASAVADLSTMRSAFAESHERVRVLLKAMVARGQAEGNIRPEIDPDAAALMVGSLLLGLSMQCLVDPSMDLEPIRRTSLATLRLSFGAAPSP